ncbi:hypothetical protein thsps21_27920 [Pseudomonas sp. No.21]|nr:hypothetical protein TUM20249_12610 [Pseudomonas tohonis]
MTNGMSLSPGHPSAALVPKEQRTLNRLFAASRGAVGLGTVGWQTGEASGDSLQIRVSTSSGPGHRPQVEPGAAVQVTGITPE